MNIRAVSSDDLPACSDVFYAAEDALYSQLNQPLLPRNPDSLLRLFGHILGSDPQSCWLAHDGGQVQAFGLAVRRDDLSFLSFLFVRPEQQGRGLGRRLLERCLPAGGYRGTCVEAIQPVSTALYASYGLVPRLPIYTLIGQPHEELPALPAELRLEPFAELAGADQAALADQVDRLDQQVLGLTRSLDHGAWSGWGRQGFVLRPVGSPAAAGYGYVHASGRVGPVVALDEALLLPLLGELLRQVKPLDAWQILVPGTAQAAYVALLRAGLRLEGPPALFCASGPGPDHARYLPATYALP